MNTKRFLLFILLVGAIAYSVLHAPLRKKPIDKIALSDRQDLEMFFKTLIYECQFGYTLFGDKPVSIEGYFIQEPSTHFAIWARTPRMSLHHLWTIWKKHEPKLHINNYILLNEPNPKSENCRTITLINKQAFLATVRLYLTDFQTVLGAGTTPGKLLEQLTLPNASLYETLNRNEVLYGILLGFGKENAAFFDKRNKFYNLVNVPMPVTENPYESYSPEFPLPNASFNDLEQEYRSIEKRRQFFGWNPPLCPIRSPQFIAIKDKAETLALEKKYREVQHQLLKAYSEGDFLEITLAQLCL